MIQNRQNLVQNLYKNWGSYYLRTQKKGYTVLEIPTKNANKIKVVMTVILMTFLESTDKSKKNIILLAF